LSSESVADTSPIQRDATTTAKPTILLRLAIGVRCRRNWLQLFRFAVVGGSGYAVNLLVFGALVHGLRVDYRAAATVAFLVAVTSNFWWNRHWTFVARRGDIAFQATRFFGVSVVAFAFSLVLLAVLVSDLGMPRLAAQAVAVACATPLGFVGNKLWTFAGMNGGRPS
jgi:putative flippase GtrA